MSSSAAETRVSKKPFYQDVDGFIIPGMFSAEMYKSALAYKPRPDDLFIVTYPKCGTTWVQNIVACILKEGRPFESALEFFSQTPFLEMTGAEAAHTMKRPGAIKLHLPFRLTPWSPEAKYIFVGRNPKDCCVSFYYHAVNIPGYNFADGKFDDFFELFMKGEVEFGDYFDTLLSWYEHRNEPNVLFITYEQLKKDAKKCILKIAEFIDPKYKNMLLAQNEQILKDVIHHSSFNFMKERLTSFFKELQEIPFELIENNPDIPQGLKVLLKASSNKPMVSENKEGGSNFVRKGIVGDWKNHFSPSQNERLEKKYRERTAGTDIPDLWKDDM